MRRFGSKVRRGFVLALVLMLTLAASLALATAFERHSMQRRIIQRQLTEYERHHEMFGVRAVIGKWLREQPVARLAEMAGEDEEEFDHGFEMPGDLRVTLDIVDGQGTLLSNLDRIPSSTRDQYEAALDRLPEGIPNLTRTVGPHQVSINAAPREVIEALLEEDGDRFARRLLRARDRGPIDQDEFDRALRVTGVDDEARALLYELTTFQPELWQAVIDVTDRQGTRRFLMTMLQETGRIQILRWTETQIDAGGAPGERGSRRNAESGRNES